MIKVKFNGHVLECFDSIQDIPIYRHQLFNLNLLIDAGLGSDINGVAQRIGNIKSLVNRNEKDKANIELDNIIASVQLVMSNLSPKHRAFVCTIHKINDRVITDQDLTESGIDEIIKELGQKRMPVGLLNHFLAEIKKKFDQEMETFFPSLTANGNTTMFYVSLKEKTVLTLKKIQTENEELRISIDKQLEKLDQFFADLINPKVYHGANGLEVQMIKNFESTCTMIHFHNLHGDPKSLTAFGFFEKTLRLKELLKASKKK